MCLLGERFDVALQVMPDATEATHCYDPRGKMDMTLISDSGTAVESKSGIVRSGRKVRRLCLRRPAQIVSISSMLAPIPGTPRLVLSLSHAIID